MANAMGHVLIELDALGPIGLLLLDAVREVNAVLERNGGVDRDEWRRQSLNEHISHAVIHGEKFLRGDASEPHLAHLATRALMALQIKIEMDRTLEGKTCEAPHDLATSD